MDERNGAPVATKMNMSAIIKARYETPPQNIQKHTEAMIHAVKVVLHRVIASNSPLTPPKTCPMMTKKKADQLVFIIV